MKVSYKSVKSECLTRVSSKSVGEEVSSKSVLQECPTRVPSKNVLQECQVRRCKKCQVRSVK